MEKIKRKAKKISKAYLSAALIFGLISAAGYWHIAQAAALTGLSDVMTRVANDESSSHDITFSLDSGTALNADETITVDFHEDDSDFTVAGASSAIADFDFHDGTERTVVGVDGDCTGHSGSNDIAVGINDTTGVVTFTACSSFTASSTGATVNIEYGTAASGTNRVTNPSAAATYVLDIGGTVGDTGKIAIAIIDDDQIPVTASVDPTISFTVTNTTLALGTISDSAVATTSYNNLTVGTNGTGGYTISVKDAGNGSNPGLYNSAASHLIASATATLAGGTEGYGGNCNKVGGSGSCTFVDGATDNVTGFTLAGGTFASYSSKPSGTETYQIRVKAARASSTDAGAYSDTLTLIATGNF